MLKIRRMTRARLMTVRTTPTVRRELKIAGDSKPEEAEGEWDDEKFTMTISSSTVEDETRSQLIPDPALAIDFNRQLDCVPQCQLTSRLWGEVHLIKSNVSCSSPSKELSDEEEEGEAKTRGVKDEIETENEANIYSTALEDELRAQMILDIATAITFNRQLTCVAMCALTSSLWDEAHPLDLATLVVKYMSSAAIEYLFGSGDVSQVESAKSHQGAGIYSLVQSFDAQRYGVYVGKSNVSVSKRINAHRAAVAKSKQSTLYRALKAFQGRPFYEILLVGFPVSEPDWYRSIWTRLCPVTAASWMQPLDSGDIRETFTSLVEACFIALRQSFPKNEQYTQERTAMFGALAGVRGLNGTPGTEDTVNKDRGGRYFCADAGLHPAVDRLQSHLTNEVRGEAGGLPQPKLKSHKYTSKKKDLTLNGYLRTCQARMFQQLLRVAVRSAAPV